VSLSIAEAVLLQDLKRRVEVLERERPSEPRSLHAINAQRVAAGQKLRQAITAIIATYPGIAAKQVQAVLDRQAWAPLPSVRTIRLHLQRLRSAATHVLP
jgi:hypothetical protein